MPRGPSGQYDWQHLGKQPYASGPFSVVGGGARQSQSHVGDEVGIWDGSGALSVVARGRSGLGRLKGGATDVVPKSACLLGLWPQEAVGWGC